MYSYTNIIMSIKNPFDYPEITTLILEYLPTKQIVNLYCHSNAIATSIRAPSHIMNANIQYNCEAKYSKFPTHQFAMYTTEAVHYRNKSFNKFIQTTYAYNPENRRLYELDIFDGDIQNYDIIDPQFDKYYMKHNMFHDMYNKKCNDVLSTDHNDTNCSLYLVDIKNVTIKDTMINHIILTKCENITIESKIKGNVVVSSCKNIKFKQRQLNDVRMLSTCLGCDFGNVRTYDLSECKIDLDIFPQYSRYDSTNNINVGYVENLITSTFDTRIYNFRDIRNLKLLGGMASIYATKISSGNFCLKHIQENYNIVELHINIPTTLKLNNFGSLEKLTAVCTDDDRYEDHDGCMSLKYTHNRIERKQCERIIGYYPSDENHLILRDCNKLEVINIDHSVKHITFDVRDCKNLKHIYINHSGNYLTGCPKMRDVQYL